MIELFPAVDPSIVAQQMDPNPVPDPRVSGITSLFASALGSFLTTLIVGAILIAIAPEYSRDRMADALAEPIESFLYGIGSLLLLFIAIFVLAITIVGIIVAIPLAILAYVIWAVGAAIAFLAIGDRLVGHGDGWTKPLLVGAAINGGLTLTGIGGLLTFAIGAVGFGTVLRGYLS